ncbi:GlxA family transcriptional regulator [Aestuariispira insulae]|uniref:AraC family transcriptional regulator with amidase-like domain n=1 Tax=Aestuariispira insulae TaxID=1461337 RepID=A0A3D9HGK4_9PROT|nr:GlxA family transcriptional regulator [Aestuariispira insulae]RED48545.1 AraC family transcriptional regulator with amidase-like domain [Aestuariispira insulae]
MADFMLKQDGDESVDIVNLFLVPNFSMIAFTSLVEPMRLANMIANKTLYRWRIISRDGLPVPSSAGIEVSPELSAPELERPSNIVVCSGIDAHIYQDALTFGWLRRWAREGSHVGAICTGAHILAHAGLLNGYRCTIHWANLDSFVEEFPDIDVRAELYETDRDRFTCAGGIAALDMMLSEMTKKHGPELAAAVSEQFMHERIREGHDDQRLPLQARLRVSHPKLIRAIAEMEKHTEEALSRDEIAQRVGLSRRQLERLFRRYLSTSPARYYLKLRLNRARTLLTQTTMPVTEVAFASGFTSASHFSKCYRDMFGRTPRAERRGGDDEE